VTGFGFRSITFCRHIRVGIISLVVLAGRDPGAAMCSPVGCLRWIYVVRRSDGPGI